MLELGFIYPYIGFTKDNTEEILGMSWHAALKIAGDRDIITFKIFGNKAKRRVILPEVLKRNMDAMIDANAKSTVHKPHVKSWDSVKKKLDNYVDVVKNINVILITKENSKELLNLEFITATNYGKDYKREYTILPFTTTRFIEPEAILTFYTKSGRDLNNIRDGKIKEIKERIRKLEYLVSLNKEIMSLRNPEVKVSVEPTDEEQMNAFIDKLNSMQRLDLGEMFSLGLNKELEDEAIKEIVLDKEINIDLFRSIYTK